MTKMPDPGKAEAAAWLKRMADSADEDAFDMLFGHYYPKLHRFMQRGGIGCEEAEELVQEALFRVWTKASQYMPEFGTPGAWIFTLARNVRSDHLRHVRAISPLHSPIDGSESSQKDASETGTEVLAMLERIQGLPREQVVVLTLAYVDGLTQAEISECLSLPLGTVKTRIRLAFCNLRRMLNIIV
ncbi:MAG: sigma-70 family RNA polymerase sigma factor [Gammaproteobacteria bacterium]|nr:sigma-70 family RNA polymerase sigma factor [Gammaproteobacteria bacterium]